MERELVEFKGFGKGYNDRFNSSKVIEFEKLKNCESVIEELSF